MLKSWYMDGTFKVTKAPFMQLFTINCFYLQWCSDQAGALLYVFMSRRRKRDYLVVFRSLLHLLPSTSVQMCVADLEKGLWNALRQLFPGIPIKGCVFHWCQAIFRKIQKSGLAVSYSSKGNAYTFPASSWRFHFCHGNTYHLRSTH
jgi:hypothetical protein